MFWSRELPLCVNFFSSYPDVLLSLKISKVDTVRPRDFFLFLGLKARCCPFSAPFTHFDNPFPLFILFGNYLPTDFKSRLFKSINFKINGFQIKQIECFYNIFIVILVLQIKDSGGILVNFRFYGNFNHFFKFQGHMVIFFCHRGILVIFNVSLLFWSFFRFYGNLGLFLVLGPFGQFLLFGFKGNLVIFLLILVIFLKF